MKILELYSAVLKMAKRHVNEDGTVSQVFGGKNEPSLIKGKRIVVPTREHLSNPDWSNRVVFHPLSENILRGESAVLEDFRHALNLRINWTIGLVGFQLLMIAASNEEHAKLSPYQSEYLRFVKNANKTTLEAFKKLMKAMPLDQTQKAFVSIYLKRAGTIGERRYSRVGVVNFPLYQELCKPDVKEIWGVKFANKKDPETIKKLLEQMIPGIDVDHSHSRGSDSGVAPYLDALMKSVMAVSADLNAQIDLFQNVLDANSPDEDDDANSKNLRFNDEWVEVFDNLDVMIPEVRMIPMQAGNDGGKPAAPAQQPTAATAPAAAPAGPLPAALSGNGWNQQAQPQAQSVFAQAAAAPGPVHTGRGLDFESLLRSNGALAQAVGGVSAPQSNGWNGNQSQGNNAPSWARPSGNSGNNWNGGGNGPSWAQGGNNGGGNWGGGYSPSI